MKGKSQLQFSQINNKSMTKQELWQKKNTGKKKGQRMKPLWTKGSTKASPVTWDSEVPYSSFLFRQIHFTKRTCPPQVLYQHHAQTHQLQFSLFLAINPAVYIALILPGALSWYPVGASTMIKSHSMSYTSLVKREREREREDGPAE